jgi:hypothetical protein
MSKINWINEREEEGEKKNTSDLKQMKRINPYENVRTNGITPHMK